MTDTGPLELALIRSARREAGRVWFWRPQWYWHGWRTLWPFLIGHDELARRTLVLGWTVTGRIVVAIADCGDVTCRADALREIRYSRHPEGNDARALSPR